MSLTRYGRKKGEELQCISWIQLWLPINQQNRWANADLPNQICVLKVIKYSEGQSFYKPLEFMGMGTSQSCDTIEFWGVIPSALQQGIIQQFSWLLYSIPKHQNAKKINRSYKKLIGILGPETKKCKSIRPNLRCDIFNDLVVASPKTVHILPVVRNTLLIRWLFNSRFWLSAAVLRAGKLASGPCQ